MLGLYEEPRIYVDISKAKRDELTVIKPENFKVYDENPIKWNEMKRKAEFRKNYKEL